MGAPTSNLKRGGYPNSYKNPSSPSPLLESTFSGDLRGAKKPRNSLITHMNPIVEPQKLSPPQSTLSRVSQYPRPQPLRREVHAPCRNFNFTGPRQNSNSTGSMGNIIRKYNVAKEEAFDSLRYVNKDKEVVDVDKECSNFKGVVLGDSSVEEVQILDEKVDRGGWSGGLARKFFETKEDAYLRETYQNFGDHGYRGSSSLVSDISDQTPNDQTLNYQTPKDDDCVIISVNRENEFKTDMTEPPHKRLQHEADSRNPKLNHLGFMIHQFSKKLSFIRRPVKTPKQEFPQEPFVKLTDDEASEVTKALSNSSRRKLLVTHADSNIEITGEVLQCLRPGAWLNDEVINLYLELLKEREKREPQKFLKCHFFNTFFYKKLISGNGGYDFKAVRRWTTHRKIGYGLIECDKIFVPIHKEVHWCLAIINKKDKKFQYLDSLKGMDSKVLHILAKYYVDEIKDKSGKDIDVSSWDQEYVHDLPAQENGFDCGMFMIKYADFYSRGLGLAFGQKNMPYFRKRTAKEILRLKAE